VEAHEKMIGLSQLALGNVCTSILPFYGTLSNNLPSRVTVLLASLSCGVRSYTPHSLPFYNSNSKPEIGCCTCVK
jgi:hypothetical protein